MIKKLSLFDFLDTLLMLAILVVIIYPFLNVLALSFSSTVYVVQNQVSFYPKGFTLKAFELTINDVRIPRAYLNTIIYTCAGTAVNLVMTTLAAYPLSVKSFFGRKVFMALILVTMFFSGGMIPNFILVRNLHMIDTIWAIIIPNAIWVIELLILKSFFESVDKNIYESAVIDGASEYRILAQFVVPLSKAALATIGLFFFMGHWNSYFIPLIYLNDSNKYPLQLILRGMLIGDTAKEFNNMESSVTTREAMKNATIVISMIPVLILYPFAQRYFTKGIMLGAVKG